MSSVDVEIKNKRKERKRKERDENTWEEETMVPALKIKASSRDKDKRYYKARTELRELTYIRVKRNKKLKETLQPV